MSWWVHRIATSDVYGHPSPHEIAARWSWREVVQANDVIDAFEDAREQTNGTS